MQDEGSGPEDHQEMQRLWKDVHIFLGCREMAQILPGVFEKSPVSKTLPLTCFVRDNGLWVNLNYAHFTHN